MAELIPLDDLLVNDRYWLGRAREMVTASIRDCDEAAGRLATAISWFWTVYTTAALIGVALADRALSTLTAALLALPAVFLVVAYALVVRALTPITTNFDPRAPEETARAHAHGTFIKRRRLTAATACTLLAALAVAGAVATTAMARPERPEPAPALHAAHTSRDGMNMILLRGQFSNGQAVRVTITPSSDTRPQARPVEAITIAGADGTVRDNITVPIARSYEVTATWNDDHGRWTLTQTVTANSATTPTPSSS